MSENISEEQRVLPNWGDKRKQQRVGRKLQNRKLMIQKTHFFRYQSCLELSLPEAETLQQVRLRQETDIAELNSSLCILST